MPRPRWLKKGDTVIGAFAEPSNGMQGIHSILWMVVLDGDKVPRLESAYPEDLNHELQVLFPIAASVHNQLLAGIKRQFDGAKRGS